MNLIRGNAEFRPNLDAVTLARSEDSPRALSVEATLPRAAFVAAIEGIAIEGGIVVDLHGRAIVGFALFGPGDIVSVNSRHKFGRLGGSYG